MNHYFMVLAALGSCETENAEVLEVVFNVEAFLRHVSTSDFVENRSRNQLATCSTQVYLSVLYTEAYENIHPGYKSLNWTLSSKISTVCSATCSVSPSKNTEFKKKLALEDVIHRLCDQLPILGTCLVDVICFTPKAEELPILEERVELFGALSRLVHWNRANLTMCSCSGKALNTSTWNDLLPFRIVHSPFDWDQLFVANTVWRGDIHLLDDTFGGFQLKCAENRGPAIDRRCTNATSGHFLNPKSETSATDLECLDGVMTVLSKHPWTSIPPHMVSSKRFELSLPYPATSSLLEGSVEFLSRVNSDEVMCFLLRLGIWEYSMNDNDNPMDTIAWKRKVVSGNFKAPDRLCRKEVGHRLFLLLRNSSCTKLTATIFALRDTADYSPQTCLRMALADAGSACERNGAPAHSFLEHLPTFSSQDVMHLRETILQKQILAIQNLIGEMGNVVPAAYVHSIFKEIGSRLISNFKKSANADLGKEPARNRISPDVQKTADFLFYAEDAIEPADWPERIFLMKKDVLREYGNDLERLLKPGEVAFLKMDELLMKLESVDKCKANISTRNQNLDVFSQSSQPRLCWPEAIYCSDQSKEAKQQQLNCLEAQHIVYDTASSLENNSEGKERQMTPRVLPLIKTKEEQRARKITPKKPKLHLQPSKVQLRSSNDKKDVNKKAASSELSEKNLQKLRIAVVDALELHEIRLEHKLFKTCAKKLFTICKTFAKDVVGAGSASKLFKEIAESHVQQVIQFETNRPTLNLRSKKQRVC